MAEGSGSENQNPNYDPLYEADVPRFYDFSRGGGGSFDESGGGDSWFEKEIVAGESRGSDSFILPATPVIPKQEMLVARAFMQTSLGNGTETKDEAGDSKLLTKADDTGISKMATTNEGGSPPHSSSADTGGEASGRDREDSYRAPQVQNQEAVSSAIVNMAPSPTSGHSGGEAQAVAIPSLAPPSKIPTPAAPKPRMLFKNRPEPIEKQIVEPKRMPLPPKKQSVHPIVHSKPLHIERVRVQSGSSIVENQGQKADLKVPFEKSLRSYPLPSAKPKIARATVPQPFSFDKRDNEKQKLKQAYSAGYQNQPWKSGGSGVLRKLVLPVTDPRPRESSLPPIPVIRPSVKSKFSFAGSKFPNLRTSNWELNRIGGGAQALIEKVKHVLVRSPSVGQLDRREGHNNDLRDLSIIAKSNMFSKKSRHGSSSAIQASTRGVDAPKIRPKKSSFVPKSIILATDKRAEFYKKKAQEQEQNPETAHGLTENQQQVAASNEQFKKGFGFAVGKKQAPTVPLGFRSRFDELKKKREEMKHKNEDGVGGGHGPETSSAVARKPFAIRQDIRAKRQDDGQGPSTSSAFYSSLAHGHPDTKEEKRSAIPQSSIPKNETRGD